MKNISLIVFCGENLKEYCTKDLVEERVKIDLEVEVENSLKEYILEMVVKNGKMHFETADELKLSVEGKNISEREIEEGDIIEVSLPDGKNIAKIQVEKSSNTILMEKYSIHNIESISIGSSNDCTIEYILPNIGGKIATIRVDSGKIIFEAVNPNNYIYINNKKISQSAELNFGDVIYIMGLKVVFLGDILALNRPSELNRCKLPVYEASTNNELQGNADKNKKLSIIQEKAYFQRSPRIVKKIEEGELEIDEPPAPNDGKAQPLLLTLGPSFTMGMAMMASFAFTFYSSRNNPAMVLPGAIMTASMLAGTILWPILSHSYEKASKRREEKRRLKRYRKYMKKEYQKLQEKIEKNKKILSSIYPEPTVLLNRAMNEDRRLWERTPSNDDFLDIRLGKGTRPSSIVMKIPRDRFTMVDDPLINELNEINKEYVNVQNIPVSISLLANSMMGVIGDRDRMINIAKEMIVQISGLHSYDEVKIVCIYNSKEAHLWEWVKKLPHVWGPEKAQRYIASSYEEAKELFALLKDVLSKREEEMDGFNNEKAISLPYYIIFIADQKMIEDEPLMRYLSSTNKNLGASVVFVFDKLNMLPKECNAFLEITETDCRLCRRERNDVSIIELTPDSIEDIDLNAYARYLSRIKVKEMASNLSLPSMLSFLEMYGVGRIEHLEIKRRWRENMNSRSLMAPLGVKAGGANFILDIHDKYHGAHGLIAGMTGSGKSEFIQSFILALAVNYNPYDVSFILIDYKGGGMANCFEGLPHVAGTITNLGGSQIMRSLVSLKSELKRRQKIFAEFKINHIDLYQQLYKEGKATEPLPHLVIISDEFAELKAQQPDFMNELVTTARIGRSLGVHLILATQKPSGVVDDQIWSNSKFKICLKVLDKSDSNEMIKKPDAAYITQPGRCFVQIGNDEIFEMIQTGWSGADYTPTDEIENEEDKQVLLIDNCGNVLRTASNKVKIDDSKKETGQNTQIANIVKYISNLAAKDGIKSLRLWLEPLAEEIFIEDIDRRSGGWNGERWLETEHWLCPMVGMLDDPKNQRQFPFTLNMGDEGSVIVYGAPGTGKTTFLQTVAYSLITSYSPETVNLYILDFGGRTMGYFNNAPHTGGIVYSDESDKLDKLFKMVAKEMETRKKRFSKYSVGTLKSYMEVSGEKVPAMVIVLDNYVAFYELYPDYQDYISTFSRDGGSYGIYLVMSVGNVSSINYKITQNFKLVCTLQLYDKYEYSSIVGQTEGLEPDSIRGRGLVKCGTVLEYQTALACRSSSEADRVMKLTDLFDEMKLKWKGRNAKLIPFVPEELTFEDLLNNNDIANLTEMEMIPVGYDMGEAEIVSINLKNLYIFSVIGQSKTGKTNFLKMIFRIVKQYLNYKLYIVDSPKKDLEKFASKYAADGYVCDNEGFENFLGGLVEEMVSRHKMLKAFRENGPTIAQEYEFVSRFYKIMVLVDDLDSFYNMVSDESLAKVENILKDGGGLGVYFVFGGNPDEISRISSTDIYNCIMRKSYGVLLGSRFDDQNFFEVSNMDYKQRSNQMDPGMGYFIDRKDYMILKTPLVV